MLQTSVMVVVYTQGEIKQKEEASYSAKSRKERKFVKLDQTKKQKEKKASSPRKSQWYQTNKPTSQPLSSIKHSTATATPLTPTHPPPPTLKEESANKKARPQGNGFRKPTDRRLLSDRSGYACKLALFEKENIARSALSIRSKENLESILSALASEPTRVTLSAEFRQGSSDGARSN